MHPSAPGPARRPVEQLIASPPGTRLGRLIDWLREAPADEIGVVADRLFGTSADSGTVEWQAVVVRWVEVDPVAAVAFGRGYSDRFLESSGVSPGSFGAGRSKARRLFGSRPAVVIPLKAVYVAWAKLDATSALASLASEHEKFRQHLADSLGDMVGEEPARAWVRANPELPDFERWPPDGGPAPPDMSDPAKAAAALSPEASPAMAVDIARLWVRSDPEAAVAWAHELSHPAQRRDALAALLDMFLSDNLERARSLLDTFPSGLDRGRAETRYAAALAAKDPEAAMEYVLANLHGITRPEAIAAVARSRSETDPLGALRLLREYGIGDLSQVEIPAVAGDASYPSDGGSAAVTAVLHAAAAHDPQAVMQLLAETGSIPPAGPAGSIEAMHRQSIHKVFSDWANRDFAAATRWLSGQPDTPGTAALASEAARHWPTDDVAGMQRMALGMPVSAARDHMIAEAARRLTAQDPVGGLAWASQMGGETAVSAAFRHLAETNTPAALDQYAEALSPEQQAAHGQHLTDQLVRHSAADAIGFFESLKPEQQAKMDLHQIALAYAVQDAEAASRWIAALPATEAKDTAIGGLVHYLVISPHEPDGLAAAHWAAASMTPETRDERLTKAAEAWFGRDPRGARAAIQASTLPVDIKQSLLRHDPNAN